MPEEEFEFEEESGSEETLEPVESVSEPEPKPESKKTLSKNDIKEIQEKVRNARTLLELSIKNRTSDGIDKAIDILTEVIKKVK